MDAVAVSVYVQLISRADDAGTSDESPGWKDTAGVQYNGLLSTPGQSIDVPLTASKVYHLDKFCSALFESLAEDADSLGDADDLFVRSSERVDQAKHRILALKRRLRVCLGGAVY